MSVSMVMLVSFLFESPHELQRVCRECLYGLTRRLDRLVRHLIKENPSSGASSLDLLMDSLLCKLFRCTHDGKLKLRRSAKSLNSAPHQGVRDVPTIPRQEIIYPVHCSGRNMQGINLSPLRNWSRAHQEPRQANRFRCHGQKRYPAGSTRSTPPIKTTLYQA